MGTFTKTFRLILFAQLFIFISCEPKTRQVIADNRFKELFYADSNGITGADGVFSILLPNGSSVFLLGDCFLGKVVDGTRDIKTPMLRNAFNLIDSDQTHATAIVRGTLIDPLTLMEPPCESGDTTYRWYWPGHGFVRSDTLYIFALNLYTDRSVNIFISKPEGEKDEIDRMAEEMFSFRIKQVDLLSFKLPDFTHIETHRVEFDYQQNAIDFGNCVLVDSGYVYIYGTKNLTNFSELHVARTPLNSKVFYRSWEYFDGANWRSDIKESAPIKVDLSISEQFSIFRYGDRYILLTMDRAGTDIFTFFSNSPYRNFDGKKLQYSTPETRYDSTGRLFTYNALAHPQYVDDGMLLVSYCVNSFNVRDIYENVECYRARFIRIPISCILPEEN